MFGIKNKIKSKIKNFFQHELLGMMDIDRLKTEILEQKIRTNALLRHEFTCEAPIKVIFLVARSNDWDMYESLYAQMVADSFFEPIVCTMGETFSQTDSGLYYSIEQKNAQCLAEIGVEHVRLNHPNMLDNYWLIQHIQPQVIFYQLQGEFNFPRELQLSSLSFARICYLPYAESILEHEQYFYSNLSIYRYGWMIFLRDKSILGGDTSFFARADSPVHFCGYPKYSSIMQSKASWPIQNSLSTFRVIWSPHHSIGQNTMNFGTFLDNYLLFLTFAKEHPEIDILLTMHPNLMLIIRDNPNVTDFLEQWRVLPNTAIRDGGVYGHLFHASDLLVTDGISWLLEYQLMKKPIIFIERSDHQAFNALGLEMIKAVHAYPSFELAVEKIVYFAQGGVDDRGSLMEVHAKMIYQESAAYDIKEAIKKKYLGELASKKLQ